MTGEILTQSGPDNRTAYWARCQCGYDGQRRSNRADAEIDLDEHQADNHTTIEPAPVPTSSAAGTAVVTYELDSWQVMQAQAEVLSRTAFVPGQYRNKPDDILAAALYGREVGFGVTTALSYIHVVEGKPTLSAEAMVALVRRAGHSISGTATAQAAYVIGKRADTGDEMELTWDMDMARRAKLDGKDNWKRYPEAMLWARAVSQVCRMLFPDVLLGLSFVPEELEEITPPKITSPPTRRPRPTPALDAGGEESPAQELEKPAAAMGHDGEVPAPGTQCPECNAPAGKHATKCSQR